MARTLSIFDLWGDMIANPTRYGNSAMREARAKQLENIQNSEANLAARTYQVARMHRQQFADRYSSNIVNNYYRWIAGGGTPDSFFKAQFAAIDADPAISGVDQETRAMIYGRLKDLGNNVAYNLYGAGQRDAADELLRGLAGYGVPEKYMPNWQTEQLMNLYGQGQQGQDVDLSSIYGQGGVDGQQASVVRDNWERIPPNADLSYMNPAGETTQATQTQTAQPQQDAYAPMRKAAGEGKTPAKQDDLVRFSRGIISEAQFVQKYGHSPYSDVRGSGLPASRAKQYYNWWGNDYKASGLNYNRKDKTLYATDATIGKTIPDPAPLNSSLTNNFNVRVGYDDSKRELTKQLGREPTVDEIRFYLRSNLNDDAFGRYLAVIPELSQW